MKRNQKGLPWLMLVVMAALTIFLLARKQNRGTGSLPEKPRTQKEKTVRNDPASNDPNSPGNERDSRNGQFNRTPTQVNYSKHARCRMGCRHIDGDEIKEILVNGAINVHKSDMRSQPDPRYALEGTTRDGQKIRVIVAQAPRASTIVTVIDLDTDWNCDCPGDERKKH